MAFLLATLYDSKLELVQYCSYYTTGTSIHKSTRTIYCVYVFSLELATGAVLQG